MKRFVITLTIGLLLLTGHAMAARVTNVELSYQDGYTVVRIDVDGAVRFTHQTEVPKDGKPDRVIVDVLSATHDLGAKTFLDVPDCFVRGIRTSQYSVEPEQIVRVVLDVAGAPVYRVDSDNHSISIYLNDKTSAPFSAWRTSDHVMRHDAHAGDKSVVPTTNGEKLRVGSQPTSAKQANAAIEKDRLASLSPKESHESHESKTGPTEQKTQPTETGNTGNGTPKPVTKYTTSAATEPPNESVPWYAASTLPEKPSKAVAPKQSSTTQKNTQATAKPQEPAAKPVAKKTEPMHEPMHNEKPSPTVAQTVAQKEQPPVQSKPIAVVPKTVVPKQEHASIPDKRAEKPVVNNTPAKPAADPQQKHDQAELAQKLTAPEPEHKAEVKEPAHKPEIAQHSETAQKPDGKQPEPPAVKPTRAETSKAPAKAVEKSQPLAAKTAEPASQNATPDESEKPRATSRFRRSAATAKVKGTMVAEFPQRLVIKYKAAGYRDPFQTLIDDSRTYDNPIETRIPNIEGLKLVGVIESPDNANRALFEDNDGYSYMLKSGDKVRNGYVLRVEADRVYFQIFEYGWSRTVALEMEY